MRRLLRRLAVLASVVGVVMALNVGVAWADHGANAPPFEDAVGLVGGEATATTPVDAPVGTHIVGADAPGNPGFVNGVNAHAGVAIGNNPNCPRHYPAP